LSGLQHLAFCERHWALIHLEQQWKENFFIAEGKLLHEKAQSAEIESRPEMLVRRTLPLRSLRPASPGKPTFSSFCRVRLRSGRFHASSQKALQAVSGGVRAHTATRRAAWPISVAFPTSVFGTVRTMDRLGC